MEGWASSLAGFAAGSDTLGGLRALVGAFLFGQLLAWVYERTYHGLSYSRGFAHTLVLVCLSAAILVLAMRHSLLAGLGLFGVLSMIRFRTDLKTPRDLVFVMGAACIGVAAGVGAEGVALMGAVAFAAAAFYLALGPFGSRTRFDGVLRLRHTPSEDSSRALRDILREYCRREVLLSSTDLEPGGDVEYVYQVKFFREEDRDHLMGALRAEIQAEGTQLMLQDASSEY